MLHNNVSKFLLFSCPSTGTSAIWSSPPPKRRCVEPLTVNTLQVNRFAAEPADVEVDVDNLENIPLQKCDVGVQWPEISEHNYCSSKSTKDSATQTYPAPSISAYDFDDKDSRFFTGIHIASFWQLLFALTDFLPQPMTIKLAVHHQLLLVLMRLRLSLMFTDLGKRFGISRTTACEIFAVWRPILARFMKEKIIAWLPRDTLERIRPQSFSIHYPKATCIIDCTEIFVQRPKNLRKRAQTYSNYKHHNTYKALYCIAPNGFVMFVSKLFGGRASDTFITRNSGLISHLIPGDKFLADRGFTITDVLPPGVTLAIPAFTRGCKELPEHEVTQTRRLANVRIHVERAIRRLKGFKMLSNIIPGRIQHVDDIVTICAGLCNLQPQLIREETEGEASEMDEDEHIDEQEEGDEYSWDMAEDIEGNHLF